MSNHYVSIDLPVLARLHFFILYFFWLQSLEAAQSRDYISRAHLLHCSTTHLISSNTVSGS